MNKVTSALALLLMVSAILFSSCSENDAVENEADKNGNVTTELTSGVQKIPLVVPASTKNVTVEYTSNGVKTESTAPFTQTSTASNSSVVSGYVLLYAPSATSVNIYNGDTVLAENIPLTGPTKTTTYVTKALSNKTVATSTKAKAYFYVRNDGTIPDETAQSSKKYFPQTSNGGCVQSEENQGEIETDLSKISSTISWQNDNGKNNTWQYVYSTDGTATEGIIFKDTPSYFTGDNFITLLKKLGISGDPNDYRIIWYVVKKQSDGWHVDGAVVKKPTAKVDVTVPESKDIHITHVVKPDADNHVEDGLYHNGGVMLYDADGDKDYNDLVVDYDIETRLPKSGSTSNFPYIKVVLNLRALSCKNLDNVSINLDGLKDYVCDNDDTHITFQGVDKEQTPCAVDKWQIPDFSGNNCTLTATVSGNTAVTAGNLQWLLNNGNASQWFNLDVNGYYNVTQNSFNGKPFATITVMFYPKAGSEAQTSEQIEETIDKIMDVAENSFTFNGKSGDYYIAPVGTPHVAEGYKITDVYKNFPDVSKTWWDITDTQNYDYTKAIDPNKSYK